MDLIDGQPTGSVRISFGYMSTLEDAQAFLRFIIATRLRPSSGQAIPQAAPGEAGAPVAESKAQNAVTATLSRCRPSPQEDTRTDSRVWNDLLTTMDTVGLCPPVLEANRTQQMPSEKAAGILNGGVGPHVITNLYLYPIKSCAAFEVRVLMAAQTLPFGLFVYFTIFFDTVKEKVQRVKKSTQKIPVIFRVL